MAWTLYEGDCLEIMRQMERESVDAVITDPPYSSGGMFRGDKAKPPENAPRMRGGDPWRRIKTAEGIECSPHARG